MDDIWFQRDEATCHIANVTIDLLSIVFKNRIISRKSDVNWPPWSCDLTPLNYFLWGAVKDKLPKECIAILNNRTLLYRPYRSVG